MKKNNIYLFVIFETFVLYKIMTIIKSKALLSQNKLNKKDNPIVYYTMLVFLIFFAVLMILLIILEIRNL